MCRETQRDVASKIVYLVECKKDKKMPPENRGLKTFLREPHRLTVIILYELDFCHYSFIYFFWYTEVRDTSD